MPRVGEKFFIMKKLEAINLNQCDELVQNQMATLMGGRDFDTSTHKNVEVHHHTQECGGDLSYTITWDCGGQSSNITECPDEP